MTGNAAALEQPVVFECAGETLVGILHRGTAPEATVGVLVVVGGPQYRVGSHRQFVLTARRLAQHGHAVMRFDYRGMGDSTGEPRNFEAVSDDIRAAIDRFLAAVPGLRRVVIFGLCDAASAALMYCLGDERLGGLILANPWVRTEAGEARAYVRHYYGQRFLQASFWRKLLSGEVQVAKSLASFAQSLRRARRQLAGPAAGAGHFIDRMQAGMQRFRGPVLVLISERDLTAREFTDLCGSSAEWSKALGRPNVNVVTLGGADHTFSSSADLERAAEECIRWLRQCHE